jgi:sugar O-acyltransferase (sialic acid O-acetyltransferase NeuD family)
MSTPIVIVGAGGFAREVLDVLEAANETDPGRWDVVGFVSEVAEDWGRDVNGRPCLGGLGWFEADASRRGVRLVCGIGSPAVRLRVVERCAGMGLEFASVVHPRAVLTRRVEMGAGVVVTAGVVLTNRIRVGDHVHLNLNVTVGHDAVIDDFVTIAPGVNVSGNVHVGRGCDLGTGSAVLQKVRIGEWSVVGAGAVVTKDLPPNCTAVGVPAQPIKSRPEGWWRSV